MCRFNTRQLPFLYMVGVSVGKKSMIFGQLANVARFYAQFHADTRKLLQDFWPPLLEQPMKFVLIALIDK